MMTNSHSPFLLLVSATVIAASTGTALADRAPSAGSSRIQKAAFASGQAYRSVVRINRGKLREAFAPTKSTPAEKDAAARLRALGGDLHTLLSLGDVRRISDSAPWLHDLVRTVGVGFDRDARGHHLELFRDGDRAIVVTKSGKLKVAARYARDHDLRRTGFELRPVSPADVQRLQLTPEGIANRALWLRRVMNGDSVIPELITIWSIGVEKHRVDESDY